MIAFNCEFISYVFMCCFDAQDFGEFMKVNRLAPMVDPLQTLPSSKLPVERGDISLVSDEPFSCCFQLQQ